MEKVTCKITGKLFNSLRGFLNHLRALKMSSKEYYDTYIKTEGEDICKCSNIKKWNKFGYTEWCSSQCTVLVEIRKAAVKSRYTGIDRDEKIQKMRIKRGNVDCNYKKRVETLEEKIKTLGITAQQYYSDHSKKGAASVSKEQKSLYTRKAMETKARTDTYGGRSCYKKYKLFNEEIVVQGYEPYILNYLQTILNKDQLIAGGKNFMCVNYNSSTGLRQYFPDAIMLDMLIEVKSGYTFNKNRSNVFEKIGGCFDVNKSVLLVIPSRTEIRNNKLDGSKKLLDWAISSQASKGSVDIPFIAIYDEG